MTQRVSAARVGCSGWHYASWAGRYYDPSLPKSKWLEAYARDFDTVELNNSFYRLPAAAQFRRWQEAVPPDFLFAVKASRYLTHLRRLRDPEASIDLLLSRARELRSTLGPILYQLPPRWVPDEERLRTFLNALPRDLRNGRSRIGLKHAVEFRDERGYQPSIVGMLRARTVALCVHDMSGSESPCLATSDFVYVRFHGYGAKYGGSYPTARLKSWATWISTLLTDRIDVFAYFNNDVEGHAVRDARRLKELLADWIVR